jgi:hypothetical protein
VILAALFALILAGVVGVIAWRQGIDRGFDEGLDAGIHAALQATGKIIRRKDEQIAELRKPRCPALLPFEGGGAVARCALADGHQGAHEAGIVVER